MFRGRDSVEDPAVCALAPKVPTSRTKIRETSFVFVIFICPFRLKLFLPTNTRWLWPPLERLGLALVAANHFHGHTVHSGLNGGRGCDLRFGLRGVFDNHRSG